jgi:hypothetical protein
VNRSDGDSSRRKERGERRASVHVVGSERDEQRRKRRSNVPAVLCAEGEVRGEARDRGPPRLVRHVREESGRSFRRAPRMRWRTSADGAAIRG